MPAHLPAETRTYLAAVLLDFGTADDVLAPVVALARRLGLAPDLLALIGAELDLGERATAKLAAL